MAHSHWSHAHCEPTPRRARIGRRAVVLHVEPRLVNVKKTVRARLRVGVLLEARGRRSDTGNQKGPNSRCGLDGCGEGTVAAAEGWLECGCHICANYRRALRARERGTMKSVE